MARYALPVAVGSFIAAAGLVFGGLATASAHHGGGGGHGAGGPHPRPVSTKPAKHGDAIPNVTLVHENERDIYGEQGEQCLDLMKSINSPRLRSAFDFANFVQAGDDPLKNWPLLKPYTTHIHIKDAVKGSGKVMPAGSQCFNCSANATPFSNGSPEKVSPT